MSKGMIHRLFQAKDVCRKVSGFNIEVSLTYHNSKVILTIICGNEMRHWG